MLDRVIHRADADVAAVPVPEADGSLAIVATLRVRDTAGETSPYEESLAD